MTFAKHNKQNPAANENPGSHCSAGRCVNSIDIQVTNTMVADSMYEAAIINVLSSSIQDLADILLSPNMLVAASNR